VRRQSTIGTEERLELVVKTLEPLPSSDDGLLAPPEASFAWDWCTDPKLGIFPNNNFIKPDWIWVAMTGWVPIHRKPHHVHARGDGSIEMLRALFQDGSTKPVTENYVLKDRLPIETCAGKPIEYEMIYPAPFPAGPHSAYTRP
jgi:hypothetical protein